MCKKDINKEATDLFIKTLKQKNIKTYKHNIGMLNYVSYSITGKDEFVYIKCKKFYNKSNTKKYLYLNRDEIEVIKKHIDSIKIAVYRNKENAPSKDSLFIIDENAFCKNTFIKKSINGKLYYKIYTEHLIHFDKYLQS